MTRIKIAAAVVAVAAAAAACTGNSTGPYLDPGKLAADVKLSDQAIHPIAIAGVNCTEGAQHRFRCIVRTVDGHAYSQLVTVSGDGQHWHQIAQDWGWVQIR